ncbi:hypothetical protein C464_10963 [Halorubrum coriense DSM 10284]|uniref:CARDB domain-containing protein n=1 Tax=Halorubrum coriense DSM 10284 TaxID=1227466 RepID=M0EEZ2_9EURY|nr:hypothetical protein [Halorubrum coriense]ELZ46330.1 hypothetical protein C464_10963 [Halorubrum coriense DSM 10284]
MQITGIHAVVAVLLVVSGTVGAASVADLGGGASVTVERTETVKPSTGDAAFEVRATLNNSDAANATRSFDLVVEGEDGSSVTVDERTLTLSAGEARRVTLSASRDALAPGRYNYTLGDDSGALATGTVTLDPPAFALSDARADRVVRGDTGTVAVTVRNDGDFRGLRNVDLYVDRDGDGAYDADEAVAASAPMLEAGTDAAVTFPVETGGLEPGTYDYRVEASSSAREGTLVVLRPATVRVAGSTMTTDAVRGDRFNGSVTLTNVGDVPGTETVRLDGPAESFDWNRSVTLGGNETATFEFDARTANLTRGNYSVAVSTANDSATAALRVRESFLKIDELDGPRSADVDDDVEFAARVSNIGDAAANETVQHRIDLDGDDDPETVTTNRTVTLAPGERTTVEFVLPADDRDRFTDGDLLGTHVYGVYSGDTNATGVVVVRDYRSGGGGSSSSSSDDEPETVSKDVITQEKYGTDYDEVSGETQSQVDEIHERQPFADGLAITEVLTREEIARQEFGLDVGRNDAFNFTAIDVETQQEIEAAFDDQFESQDGDRIESWDELAREEFDSEYEALDGEQKETIRERYRAQFDS